jgi:hypothetical protein
VKQQQHTKKITLKFVQRIPKEDVFSIEKRLDHHVGTKFIDHFGGKIGLWWIRKQSIKKKLKKN